MSPLRRNPACAALVLVLLGGLAGPALGDEPTEAEIAAARQLFNEGKDFEKQNAWADALARFKKVAEVKMTPQVRFHIALCEENLGRLVSAINGFELAADEAKQSGALATDVQENAPARAEALRKRVPHIHLTVKGRLTSSRILLDSAAVAPALVGSNIPVDPGTHAVDVETDGKNAFHKEVTLAERAMEDVELPIDDPEKTAGTTPAGSPTTAATVAPPAVKSEGLSFPPPLPVLIAGGVGVASLIGAGVFFGLRQSTISEVRDTCTDPDHDRGCDDRKKDVADRGATYTIVGDVLVGVGAAGVLAAGVLWFAVPSLGQSGSNAAPNRTSVRVAPTARGVRVVGTF